MSTLISFDYEAWLDSDVIPNRPGDPRGVAAIRNGMDLSHAATRKQELRDPGLGGVELSVIELLAGAIEFCRRRGIPGSEVEQRVRAYLRNDKGTPRYQLLSDQLYERSLTAVADPKNQISKVDAAKLAQASNR